MIEPCLLFWLFSSRCSHVAQHKLSECIALVVRFGPIRLMYASRINLVQKAHPEFS